MMGVTNGFDTMLREERSIFNTLQDGVPVREYLRRYAQGIYNDVGEVFS